VAAGLLALGVGVLVGALGGCEQATVLRIRQGAELGIITGPADPGHLQAAVTLCRRISSKTDRRYGIGRSFSLGQDRRVVALVDFHQAKPGRTYPVHLVWLAPGGKEIFRKYAEVTLSDQEPGFQADILWRKAEDFSYRKQESLQNTEPRFVLDSQLNIGPERDRAEGVYTFQVYLFRELILEEAFELQAS
jgi:hypothetical protein